MRAPPPCFAMRLLFYLLISPILGATLSGADDPLATLRAGHPRLLFTAESMAAALAAAQKDPLRAKLHHEVVRAAEARMNDAPIRYVLVGPRMLDQSRKALGLITTSAMAYRLTGDTRFSDHARDVGRAGHGPVWTETPGGDA